MRDTQAETDLMSVRGLNVVACSAVTTDGVEYGLAHTDDGPRLAVLASTARRSDGFEGTGGGFGDDRLLLCPLTPTTAAVLRSRLPWLRPQTLGLRTSVGFGDRLGLATPVHVRALRAADGGLAPIFAQQSIREMERTGRTPQQVMDDAIWGVFAEG